MNEVSLSSYSITWPDMVGNPSLLKDSLEACILVHLALEGVSVPPGHGPLPMLATVTPVTFIV